MTFICRPVRPRLNPLRKGERDDGAAVSRTIPSTRGLLVRQKVSAAKPLLTMSYNKSQHHAPEPRTRRGGALRAYPGTGRRPVEAASRRLHNAAGRRIHRLSDRS